MTTTEDEPQVGTARPHSAGQVREGDPTTEARPPVVGLSLRPDRALGYFCLLALTIGTAFAVITPSVWGADEATHLSRVWSITEGLVTPHQAPDPRGTNWGGDIPASVDDLAKWSSRTIGDHPTTPFPQIENRGELETLDSAPLLSPPRGALFVNTVIYSPVAYLPALAGMEVAKATDLSVGSAILVMRLFGLVAYTALVGAGIAALRAHRARWLVFIAGLIPMSLFQASTITTDTMTIGLCVLAGALLLKTVFLRQKLGVPDATGLFLAAALIPLCKSGYAIFLPLALLVPAALLPAGRRGKAGGALVLFIGAATFAWWSKITAVTSSAMGFMRPQDQWGSIIPERQAGFVLEHPITFARIVINTLSSKDTMYFTQFFGDLGFTFVSIPALATVSMIVALFIAFGNTERASAPMRSTLAVAFAVVLGIAMVFGALYLGFSPVGYYVIDGVQGRYFLPFVLLVLGVILRMVPLRWHLPEPRNVRACETSVIVLVASALLLAVLKYYFVVWV